VNSSQMRTSRSNMKRSFLQLGLILFMIAAPCALARAQDGFSPRESSAFDSIPLQTPGVSAADLGFVADPVDDDDSSNPGGIDLMDNQATKPSAPMQPQGNIQPTGLEANPSSQPTSAPSTIASTAPSTQPEQASAVVGNFPTIAGTFGLEEFVNHFAPYEPMYFVGSTQAPNIKFQFSLRYRLFTPTGSLATEYPFFRGFNFAYSQTSFWNVSNFDQPFFYDTSYRPEVFYYLESFPGIKTAPGDQFGLQGGVGHESNGQVDPNHRSMNIVFLRPIVTIGNDSGWFFTFAPKFYDYIGGLPLNPDMPKYRGYADLRVVAGLRDSLQLAAIGRVGRDGNRGSIQLDLTYPLTKLLNGNMDISLDAQYFNGYGDSLLTYNQRTTIFRFGLALVR
jgi:phospholipase A1/A2